MKKSFDLFDVTLVKDRQNSLLFEDTLLIVAFPVYAGRVPSLFSSFLKDHLSCHNCTALAIATYGNRDYDDALVEIEDILDTKTVPLVGAATIIAQHSFTNKVGSRRPDIEDFQILDRLAALAPNLKEKIQVKGNRPYKTGMVSPDPPYMSVADAHCTHCGRCLEVCPTDAMKTQDPSLCIHCCACVKVCSHQARSFVDERFLSTVQRLETNCQEARKSELFVS
jgi:ferredoxin